MAKKRTIRKSTAKPLAGDCGNRTSRADHRYRQAGSGLCHAHQVLQVHQEAEVRLRFIDPFWRALGWTIGDPTVNPADAEVIIEKSVEVADAKGIRNRRPDYRDGVAPSRRNHSHGSRPVQFSTVSIPFGTILMNLLAHAITEIGE